MSEVPLIIDLAIGEKIRLYRTGLGISMRDLAEKVDLSVQMISKYELGQNRIYAGKLYEIAVALGVPIHDFFEHIEFAAGADFSREWLELARIYQSIHDPLTRKRLRDLAKVLMDREEVVVSEVLVPGENDL